MLGKAWCFILEASTPGTPPPPAPSAFPYFPPCSLMDDPSGETKRCLLSSSYPHVLLPPTTVICDDLQPITKLQSEMDRIEHYFFGAVLELFSSRDTSMPGEVHNLRKTLTGMCRDRAISSSWS